MEFAAIQHLPLDIKDIQGCTRLLAGPPRIHGGETDYESGDDTESVRSVIYVKPCEVSDCEKCT